MTRHLSGLIAKIRSVLRTENEPDESKPKKFPCQLAFVLSCVGYSVGLGNIWQFPYLTYENGHDGGGAFLLIYLLLMMVISIPLVILHLALGQFTSSPVTVVFSRMKPYATGLGWTMIACSVITNVWYAHVSTWVEFYLFRSFSGHTEWANCKQNLSTECNCWDGGKQDQHAHLAALIYFINEVIHSALHAASCTFVNGSCELSTGCYPNLACVLESNERCSVAHHSDTNFQWDLALCLILFYLLVFLCLARGIKTGGRVVYFTATFPYMVLLMFLLPVFFLEGAQMGRAFLFRVNWPQLLNYQLWAAAARQAVFGIGTSYGVLVTMASYSKFMNNFYRDGIIIALVNVSASFLSSLVTFQIVGHLSVRKGVGIADLLSVDTGVALPFVTYAAALNLEPLNHRVWPILFYSMLFMAAIDSQFCRIEGVSWVIQNSFPKLKGFESRLIAFICFCQMLMGLPLCFSNTFPVFLSMFHSLSPVMLVCTTAQFLVVSYGYGWKHLFADMQMMLGYRYVLNNDWIELVHGQCENTNCLLVKDPERQEPCYHRIIRDKTSARTHCPTNRLISTVRSVFGPTGEHVRLTLCYIGPFTLACLLMLTIYKTVTEDGDFHLHMFAALPVIFGLSMSGVAVVKQILIPEQCSYFRPDVSWMPDRLTKKDEIPMLNFTAVTDSYSEAQISEQQIVVEEISQDEDSEAHYSENSDQQIAVEVVLQEEDEVFLKKLAALASKNPQRTTAEWHEMLTKKCN